MLTHPVLVAGSAALALTLFGAPAPAQTCPATLARQPSPDDTLPYKLHGRMVFEHENAQGATDSLYLTDFDAGATSQIIFTTTAAPTTPVALSQPLNPNFSADGRYMVFTAVTYPAAFPKGRRDIYVSTPTGAHLVNLTVNQDGSLPKLDARFSVTGSDIVYDQLGYTYSKNVVSTIYKITVNLPSDYTTDPTVSAPPAQILFDNIHQFSGPAYSPSGRMLVFSESTTGLQSVWRYDTLLQKQTPISDTAGLQTYFPLPEGPTSTFFIGWTVRTGRNDQLFIYTPAVSSTPKLLPLNDPKFDTSDFALYDEDTAIVASDRCGDSTGSRIYKFYIGSITTGQYWRLAEAGLNGVMGPVLGQSYTPLKATN